MWRRLLLVTGLAALLAWLLRRRPLPQAADVLEEPLPDGSPDPSAELRRRLDAVRRREEGATAAEQLEQPEQPDGGPGLDDLRRDVHERARAAAEEMRGSPE